MSISEPDKITTPWASTGSKNPIPANSNNTTGAAGFDKGFPDITMTPEEAGGIPPAGQDFNGILYQITDILRYMQAGGQATFSSALSTAIGGYPVGALVLSNDGTNIYKNNVSGNTNNPNTVQTGWSVVDIGLKELLATSSGSDYIGMVTGTLTDYLAKQRGIDPRLPPYNYKPTNSLAVRSASLNAAFADANSSKLGIVLYGQFSVSPFSLVGHTEYAIYGSGAILIQGGTGAGIEIKNCTGLKSYGNLIVSGNATLTCGVKVWAQGSVAPFTCSLHRLCFSVVNCDLAWQFGDLSAPDNLLSEIVVADGHTYNCRRVFSVIGSQAVIEFNGYQLISVDGSIGSSTPQIGDVTGGVVHINGGEVQMPGVSTGYGFTLFPLNSPGFENRYGSVYIAGSAVEIASLWCLAYNPSSVPSVAVGSGRFSMDACSGFANFSGENVQCGPDFSGRVTISPSCDFHRTSPKSVPIVGCDGATVIEISPTAFDGNFPMGLGAIRGGVAIFSQREIFRSVNLSGQSFPVGTSVIKPTVPVTTGDYARFNASFVNGAFTVPLGGLRDVTASCSIDTLAARPGDGLTFYINGVAKQIFEITSRYNYHSVSLGDLAAGNVVTVGVTTAAGFSVGSNNNDFIAISANCNY
jgi:hypothetical protein